MKGILVFILGIAVGIGGLYLYERRDGAPRPVPSSSPAGSVVEPEVEKEADRTGEEVRSVGNRISDQLESWNLSPDNIRRELAETGRVIRNKALVAGARIDDARIVSVVKAKYVLDDTLKALDINVDCRDGNVTLRGRAPSAEAIGRAVALALETDGVTEVNSELKTTR